MKIKAWIKKYAREILLSVIVSVITAGIIKGFEWVTEIAPSAGNSVWRFFSNSFYSSAAKMTNTSLITILFAALLGLAMGYVYMFLSKAIGATKKAIVTAEDILDGISNPKTKAPEKSNVITVEEIKDEAKDIIKDAKKGRRTTIIGIIFFVLYFGRILVFDYAPHGLWTDYQRDLLMIAPYIEQQELDQIKSDWVCMQCREDYEEIYRQIDEIPSIYVKPVLILQ